MFTFSMIISAQLLAAPVKIDDIIPDEKFRSAVIDKDANADGYFSDEELHSITFVGLHGKNGVKSIKGLEYLTSLTYLIIEDVPATGILDLSKHSALQDLQLVNNGFDGLNVSGCSYLKSVTIKHENIGLLDLSQKKRLFLLDNMK